MSAADCHIQLFSRTSASPVQWRLLSGNNREIARSADAFPDAETCRIAIKELQARSADLERRIVRLQNRWSWELLDAGHTVVLGHSVDRLVRCEQALAAAATHLAAASVGTTVTVSTARRWGSRA